jgi:hypothetical protein
VSPKLYIGMLTLTGRRRSGGIFRIVSPKLLSQKLPGKASVKLTLKVLNEAYSRKHIVKDGLRFSPVQ